jgi:hypothetical protein
MEPKISLQNKKLMKNGNINCVSISRSWLEGSAATCNNDLSLFQLTTVTQYEFSMNDTKLNCDSSGLMLTILECYSSTCLKGGRKIASSFFLVVLP